MLKPIDKNTVLDYSLVDDTENPTVFKIRCLTGSERLLAIAKKTSMETIGEGAVMSMVEVIRYGLVGWKNFGEAEFNQDNMGENISLLDSPTIAELSAEIMRISGLDDTDKKKSV